MDPDEYDYMDPHPHQHHAVARFRPRSRETWQHKRFSQFLQEKSRKKQTLRICSESGDQRTLSIPYDLLFMIFVLLPAETLCKLQFVCKEWFNLINSLIFIEFHKQQSETVLISKVQCVDKFFVSLTGDSKPKPHFHYVDFGRGHDNFVESSVLNVLVIQASYDGLILGVTDDKSLILMNPITRKHTKLALGTTGFQEGYGLVYCSKERSYKVVHLFREPSGYTGCEILTVNTRKWTIIDGPSQSVLRDITLMPISVGESLYWMPRIHGCESIFSLNVENEKFITKKLPIACTKHDRLVEIGGVLGFVTHTDLKKMQVWILVKGRVDKTLNWVKRYTINLHFDARLIVPLCSSRNGRLLVFKYPGKNLYAYDFQTDEMEKICSGEDEADMLERDAAEHLFIPHRNTLLSWNHHYSDEVYELKE